MGSSVRTVRVAAAREEFLASGSPVDGAVSETILTSWRRSRLAGVDTSAPAVPYDDAIDHRSELARAAEPVIDQLSDELGGLPVSIVLSDAHGRVIDRRDCQRELAERFDRVYFAPGFNYAEAHLGTNGVGTALEERRPLFVCGPEHFNERSASFGCAGAPILNPLTKRVEGVLDLSSLAADADPMMLVIARRAAADIEHQLVQHSGAGQRLVFEQFLAACRRSGSRPVVAISGDMVLSNSRASTLLTPADETMLQLAAAEADGVHPGALIELSLAEGLRARVRCHPIMHRRHLAGVLFEVHPARARSAHPPRRKLHPAVVLPGLAGRSPGWLDACEQARSAVRYRAPVLLVGESGVGKLALARGAHQDYDATHAIAVIDCGRSAAEVARELTATSQATPATIVLRHLGQLPPEAIEATTELIEGLMRRPTRPWLVGTVGAGVEVRAALLRLFSASATVPPLRHRADDLDVLVPALLGRLAPTRHVDCTPEAMSVLAHYVWPGNVAELQRALRWALARRLAGPIRREDLPAECISVGRRTLTPIEALERDAIVSALTSAKGNKKQAAQDLRMPRSSLYRKIRSLGIAYVDDRSERGA